MTPLPAGGVVDAIVVGSGFGGAVAAARLAQAGLRVVVVERGRRWGRGSFPRNTHDVNDRWLWQKDRGLYDVRWLDRMVSVQGAGWGGGSLVYANVFTRPPAEAFERGWPSSYTRSTLDPYYDLAAHMLEVHPITTNPATGALPARTVAMEQVVGDMSRAAGTVRPQLAVRFAGAGEPGTNVHGVTQHGCTFVGECVLGCNVGAKNSLDYNYLALAERHGAVALTETEALGIAPSAAGYEVTVRDHQREETTALEARTVFVAAGAVGSTELLLRCRDVSGTLPGLSPALGSGFSGNGDYLAFIKGSSVPLRPDEGPTITTSTVVDFDLRERQVWFQAQDGAYPRVLAGLVAGLDPTRVQREKVKAAANRVLGRLRIRLSSSEALRSNMMTMLVMGRDTANGRLTLDKKHQARLAWRNRDNHELYKAEGQVARLIAHALGGRVALAPTWRFLRQAVTVHNLGGVPMGDSDAAGVIDHHGEVHGYPGLYVVDGAAVPTATGVNPSATIAAVAERNVERAIRRLTDDPSWSAPESADVRSVPAPEDAAAAYVGAQRRERSGDGVTFRERLVGTLDATDLDPGTPGVGHGTARPGKLELRLRVALPGWRRFLDDPDHALRVSGTARADQLGDQLDVAGVLQLFPAGRSEAMRYLLTLTAVDGRSWDLNGTKTRTGLDPRALWADLTRLSVDLSSGATTERWCGTLRIHLPDVIALAVSIRGDAFSRVRRIRSALRFLAFFARSASRTVGSPSDH